MYIELAILALFIFCYSLVAGRLERAAAQDRWYLFLQACFMGPLGLGWFDGDASRTALRVLVDLTPHGGDTDGFPEPGFPRHFC